jgi:VWFA-related protein
MRNISWIGLALAASAWAQQPPANPPAATAPGTIFKTETRLVPVDVVVQDKKGNYIHDLEQKDFKVWEDNKEQQIRNFSFEADPASPLAQQKKYLVLFFDLASMNNGDQIQARQAAVKFIDANAGPNRVMAVVNFGGSLQITQNFTDDIERLKAAATGVRTSAVTTSSAGGGGGPMLRASQFGRVSMLLSLRTMAKNLGEIPGRKTMVVFSSGFVVPDEMMSEVTAAIDACNRANVALYPVDVRGLTTNTMPFSPERGAVMMPGALRDAGLALAAWPTLRIAALFAPQAGRGSAGAGSAGAGGGASSGAGTGAGAGGGASSGGGVTRGGGGASPGSSIGGAPGGANSGIGGGSRSPGGSPTGSPSGRGGNIGGNPNGPGGGGGNNGNFGGRGNPNDRNQNQRLDPMNRRGIIPRFPDSASRNQQVLYMLADGTGGFVIANTNDLLGGLQKISKEQNEYYLLAYAPPESPEGSCHQIRVKLGKGSYNVRARSGYCNVKQVDLLSGKPVEKQLEGVLASADSGTLKAPPLQAPFFYTSTNTARVHVAMEIPTSAVKFEKVKGKQHTEISILGIAYRADGGIAAKFSDSVKRDFEDKKDAEKFTATPLRYENQFDVGSGEYTLKVAFSEGASAVGKLQAPLKIDPYDTAQFSMSSLALSSKFADLNASESLDEETLEGRTPMMVGKKRFDPAVIQRFKPSDTVAVYFEVYEPLLQEDNLSAPLKIAAVLRIVDRADNSEKMNSGGVEVTQYARKGNPVAPIALRLPIETLKGGAYTLEIKVVDSAGRTWTRSTDFALE